MTHIAPQYFIEKAWEVLPNYIDGRYGMGDAVENGKGTCLHRSIIIGREALLMGFPAMRRITFGADQDPYHYSNYLRIDEGTVHVSTGRSIASYSVGSHDYELDFLHIYAIQGAVLRVIDPRDPPLKLSAIIIPEAYMKRFSGCHKSSEFIVRSCELTQDELPTGDGDA